MGDNDQIKEIAIYIAIIIIGVIAAQHMNVVVSESMEPVFYRGDIVLVEKANFLGIHEFNPEDVKKGDIVIYNA
ncbi:MAG: S26 family signal peptidase, partial [Methanobacteriaceae archaeon]|nr:S26 family signal peptidase [Methanobacteriaceae archaeon]MDP3484440.1 S26 family signal peptidase [Methanobacteriaceae archaeon]